MCTAYFLDASIQGAQGGQQTKQRCTASRFSEGMQGKHQKFLGLRIRAQKITCVQGQQICRQRSRQLECRQACQHEATATSVVTNTKGKTGKVGGKNSSPRAQGATTCSPVLGVLRLGAETNRQTGSASEMGEADEQVRCVCGYAHE